MKYELAGFVKATAGHDKDTIYVIVGQEDGNFLLADGKEKTLEHPKRKNKKHAQLIENPEASILIEEMRQSQAVRNETIKRAIKLCRKALPVE